MKETPAPQDLSKGVPKRQSPRIIIPTRSIKRKNLCEVLIINMIASYLKLSRFKYANLRRSKKMRVI
jgi:hypothetical protein